MAMNLRTPYSLMELYQLSGINVNSKKLRPIRNYLTNLFSLRPQI